MSSPSLSRLSHSLSEGWTTISSLLTTKKAVSGRGTPSSSISSTPSDLEGVTQRLRSSRNESPIPSFCDSSSAIDLTPREEHFRFSLPKNPPPQENRKAKSGINNGEKLNNQFPKNKGKEFDDHLTQEDLNLAKAILIKRYGEEGERETPQESPDIDKEALPYLLGIAKRNNPSIKNEYELTQIAKKKLVQVKQELDQELSSYHIK